MTEQQIQDVVERAQKKTGKTLKPGSAILVLLGYSDLKAGAPRGNQNAVGNAGRWKQTESDDESEEE